MPHRRVAFFADENVAPRVVQALRERGYDVYDVKEEGLFGLKDTEILRRAVHQRRIVLTHDRDFSHALFRPPARHYGIVIIRLSNQAPPSVIERLPAILQPRLLKRLSRSVVLVTNDSVTIVH